MVLLRILELIATIEIVGTLWFWGFTTGRNEHERWWIGIAVATCWPFALALGIYARRMKKK